MEKRKQSSSQLHLFTLNLKTFVLILAVDQISCMQKQAYPSFSFNYIGEQSKDRQIGGDVIQRIK